MKAGSQLQGQHPILVHFLEDYVCDTNYSSSILAVMNTGEVIVYPHDDQPSNYQILSKDLQNPWVSKFLASKEAPEFIFDLFNRENIAFHSKITPMVLGVFSPAPNCPISADIIEETKLLIITGVLIHGVPSIAFYNINNCVFKEMYSDSLFGTCAISYCSQFCSYAIIPRTATGEISLITFPPSTGKYHHRIIPHIIFSGSHTKRTTHIIQNRISKWPLITWNDENCPTIILWKFDNDQGKPKQWFTRVIDFCIPAYITNVQHHPVHVEKIGFTIEIENCVAICVWDVREETQYPYQVNFILENAGDIKAAKWIFSANSPTLSYIYAVSTSTGYYEHNGDSLMTWPDYLYDVDEVCSDIEGNRFYFGDDMELRTIQRKTLLEKAKATMKDTNSKKLAPIPLIVNEMGDKNDMLSALHLHRCANCKKPLLFPLVSDSHKDHLSRPYCSYECQAAHWPNYVATNQSLHIGSDDYVC